MTQVVFCIAESDAKALDETAARAGMSKSEYCRRAVMWAMYGAPSTEESE